MTNTEPVVGAQHARAQGLQWFLSESRWDLGIVKAHSIELLVADPQTAPDEGGALLIHEHGNRKWDKHTAHVGKYSASGPRLCYPLAVDPYTPAHHFEKGKADPGFRTS